MKTKKECVVSKSCVACGSCVKKCPLGAMSVYKGLYAVSDATICAGCGTCSRVCSAGVISMVESETEAL